jgi:hypothetical protein
VRGRASGDSSSLAFFSNNNATEQLSIFSSSSENAFFGTGSRPMTFSTNSAEHMRIDSAGNVGIGTSSPGGLLQVSTRFRVRSDGVILWGSNVDAPSNTGYLTWDTDVAAIGFNGTGALRFDTSNLERMRLDSSGNLGLGVTPSAWATLKGLQVGNASVAGFGNFAYLNSNAFYDGSDWKYISNGPAGKYDQVNSIHAWYTSASGTAGDAISFTQAATLTADGDFLVGTTTAFARLSVIVPSGADRNLIQAGVTAATDGLTVKWNHATSTIRMNIQNLPTSSAGLAAGDLYNDSGTLKVA